MKVYVVNGFVFWDRAEATDYANKMGHFLIECREATELEIKQERAFKRGLKQIHNLSGTTK